MAAKIPRRAGFERRRKLLALRSILSAFGKLGVVALIAVAFVAGRLMRPQPPPLTIERRELPLPALLAQQSRIANGATQQGSPSQPATQSQTPIQHGPDGTASERPTDPFEVVSICGARTKKGTPCSRRVRGTGRCWQHRGRPAMLPPSKLIVQDGQ